MSKKKNTKLPRHPYSKMTCKVVCKIRDVFNGWSKLTVANCRKVQDHPVVIVKENPKNKQEVIINTLTHVPNPSKKFRKVITNIDSGYIYTNPTTARKKACSKKRNIKISKRLEKKLKRNADKKYGE